MENNNEIEAFLAEIETEQEANKGERTYVQRETLKATIDEDSGYSQMYEGYILEGFTEGIEGQYGVSTAVRLIAPSDGRRMTLWLTGYEQEHLKNFIQSSILLINESESSNYKNKSLNLSLKNKLILKGVCFLLV